MTLAAPLTTTLSLTFAARSLRCMLQVFPSYRNDEKPTWAMFITFVVRPVLSGDPRPARAGSGEPRRAQVLVTQTERFLSPARDVSTIAQHVSAGKRWEECLKSRQGRQKSAEHFCRP